ncbi:hypothetical protein [Thermomonas haemolytica]|uniref:hypothetical protein n=1 Tax=Thermomonas haemolytica TaxID=141949 RepID=UPI00105092D9|nr:hypothetical protein [Thermomonas haemolytica]
MQQFWVGIQLDSPLRHWDDPLYTPYWGLLVVRHSVKRIGLVNNQRWKSDKAATIFAVIFIAIPIIFAAIGFIAIIVSTFKHVHPISSKRIFSIILESLRFVTIIATAIGAISVLHYLADKYLREIYRRLLAYLGILLAAILGLMIIFGALRSFTRGADECTANEARFGIC